LRTPLHNVMGQTEVALSRDRTPAEYRDVLQSNLEELNRLARMTNGLLFLARADDPRTQIEPSLLDARAELEAVRDFHEALADALEVDIVCEGTALVVADPNLFRRAVTNLLSNALRHSGRGSRVVLAAEPGADAITISVRDEGSGIAPEHLPMVFDRFYRTGRRDLDRGDGSGLGLAIVRSIMNLHEGTASIDSKLGRGTVVQLRFPIRPLTAGAPAAIAGAAIHEARGAPVLT
jgi:two-component system heavy metal sensor histidine kinase CusS